MTEEQSHQFIHAAELAERYVAGRMPDAERVAFEDHFAACAQCQRDVRFAAAVRTALARPGAAAARRSSADLSLAPGASGARPGRRHAWWTGAAAAAGIAAVLIIRAAPSPAVTALSAVDVPPAYLGIAVRSTAGRGEAMFESAMHDYAAGQYAAAGRQLLQEALAAGEDSVPTEFFIGASFLFSGDARSAAPVFARVVAKGESPYLAEARWYQAKALLRLGHAADAVAVLAAHASADPVVAARLNALADSIKRTGVR